MAPEARIRAFLKTSATALCAAFVALSSFSLGAEAARAVMGRWFFEASPAMHRDLGDMYVADPRFAKTYDDVEPDLAPYVTSVITAYCAKRGVDENCGS